jgi:hypothetical protein
MTDITTIKVATPMAIPEMERKVIHEKNRFFPCD